MTDKTTLTREQVIEQSRIDFECYFLESRRSKGKGREPTFKRYEHDGTYIDDHTQRHWWTWQKSVMAGFTAGRNAGLLEASAKLQAAAQGGALNPWAGVLLSTQANEIHAMRGRQ
jgi:hypothetical protein